jgi:hypothetical protein
MTKIPPILIERLQDLAPRFIRVAKLGKVPIDPGWIEHPLHSNDLHLQAWLKGGGNYGIMAGDGLAILDADNEEIKQVVQSKFPSSFSVESPGHNGLHYYFLSNLTGKMFLQTKGGEHGGEVLWSGFMAVGPGSVHPNGQRYRIVNDAPLAHLSKRQLASLLGEYLVPEKRIIELEKPASTGRKQTPLELKITAVVPVEGLTKRGDEYYGPHPLHGSETGHNFWINLKKDVWYCFRHQSGGGSLLWFAVQEGVIPCEDARPGALRGKRFTHVLEKARERGIIEEPPGDGERRSQASTLVHLLLDESPLLFHDERKTPYIRCQNSPHQNIRLRTMEFRSLLAGLLWQTERQAPSSEAVSAAYNVLHLLAMRGPMVPLHTRVAWQGDALYLDLGDETWRAVKITRDGWTVGQNPPNLFRRHTQQLSLPEPVRGGDPWRLLRCLNVRREDHLLFMVYVGTLFIPDIPHVILMLHGPQGSSKSTLMTLLKDLLDPSAVGVAALPREERELIQALDHSYLVYFDNVGSLPDWASDALCRATTGAGFSKRQLYTDDEDVIYRIQRPIGLNGINIAAQKPDLLDRSLLIGLEQIPETQRRTIADVRAEFSAYQPSILGGFLDVVVKAVNRPEPQLDRTYRMADFVSWGHRMAEALGRSGTTFLDAYRENVRQQAEEAVRSDILAEALVEYLEGCEETRWRGTATTLLNDLKAEAERLHIGTRQRAWPKAAHALTRRLKLLKDPLSKIGYNVEFTREGKESTRIIYLEKTGNLLEIASEASVVSATQPAARRQGSPTDGTDAIDGIFETFPGIPHNARTSRPTLIERVEHYVREHGDVGTLKAAMDLDLRHDELLQIAAGSPNLVFDSGKRRTIRWRPYFDSSNDGAEEDA